MATLPSIDSRRSIIALLLLGIFLLFSSSCNRQETALSKAPALNIKRVVLVTIDTLRADHLEAYGYKRPSSPFIDGLAKEGAVFERAFSASSHTAPSHASLFTGLFPFEHGVLRNHDSLSDELYSIAKFATENNFTAVGFPATSFLEGKVGFPDLPQTIKELVTLSERFWYRNAEQILKQVNAWLSTSQQASPFLMWVHFYDVHQWQGSGHMPVHYLNELEKQDASNYLPFWTGAHNIPVSFHKDEAGLIKAMNGYDARLRYVDDQVRHLFQAISTLGPETLWIITADHGEGLGNHNYEGHGQFLYNEQLHVPLIFYYKGATFAGKRYADLVRSVDILPTVAELMGQPVQRPLRGVSIAPLLLRQSWKAPHYSFAQRRPKDLRSHRRDWEEGDLFAVQSIDQKLIDHTAGSDEHYDLKHDSFESDNLAIKDSTKTKELRAVLSKILETPLANSSQMNPTEPLDEKAIEELKTLGYL